MRGAHTAPRRPDLYTDGVPDRVERFFESVSIAPWVVGAGVAGCLIALELATAIWTGRIAELLASDDPFGIRDARLAVVSPLVIGYLLAAVRGPT